MRDSRSQPDWQRAGGSFRDPSGAVFFQQGKVFRTIDPDGLELFRSLSKEPWFQKWMEAGKIIPTKLAPEFSKKTLESEFPGAAAVLEHEKLPWISMPAEWSFSMLADAALLTLELQEALAKNGLGLKDASAYNIQFRRGKPIFIDTSSIEKPQRMDLWFALGQFNRMFLFPLLLMRHKGWDFRSYFLGSLDGRNPEQVSRSFSPLDMIRPSLWLDLWLPLWLERKNSGEKINREKRWARQGSVESQLLNLRRLKNKIQKLAAGYQPKSLWASYTGLCNYTDESGEAKKGIVRAFLNEYRPRTVLDLGCNTGEYTRIAQSSGAMVLAADADHDAVELLYREIRSETAEIYPMVLDIANPTPAIGYLNQERASFFERAQVECVLALALIHHLLVSANFPLEAIRDLFLRLTQRWLVLEFVPREDSMFQRLVEYRVDLYSDYSLEKCKDVFRREFDLVKEQSVKGSSRTLLVFRKRA